MLGFLPSIMKDRTSCVRSCERLGDALIYGELARVCGEYRGLYTKGIRILNSK